MAAPLILSAPARAERMRPVGHDVTAPATAFSIMGGGTATFDAFPGNAVVVAFWATWCAPCREELPALARLRERLGVGVLAVNAGETEARISPFLRRNGMQDLPVMLDPDRKAMVEWRVTGLPTAYVVGPDRRIRYVVIGEIDWDDPGVKTRILALRHV